MVRKTRQAAQEAPVADLQRVVILRQQENYTEAAAVAQRLNTADLEAAGVSLQVVLGEARLQEGFPDEAEHCFRQALAANGLNEEACALIGRIFLDRGDPQGALTQLQPLSPERLSELLRSSGDSHTNSAKKQTKGGQLSPVISSVTAGLVAEGLLTQARCYYRTQRLSEAIHACDGLLSLIETAPSSAVAASPKVQRVAADALSLLPQLYGAAGQSDAIPGAFQRAIKDSNILKGDAKAAVEREYALFLLYGRDATDAISIRQGEGDGRGDENHAQGSVGLENGRVERRVREDNLQEASRILLGLQKRKWDKSVMEHLKVVLSKTGQYELLVQQYEAALPGVISRSERWYNLAVYNHAAGRSEVALDCLRKALGPLEQPNDVPSLLLAANICSRKVAIAEEGVEYGRRAVENAEDSRTRGEALHSLGVNLASRCRGHVSDAERLEFRGEAEKSINGALSLDPENRRARFDLALFYAEEGKVPQSLKLAKALIREEGLSNLATWQLLALLLSAQHKYREAEEICDAALEGSTADQVGQRDASGNLALLRIRGKVQLAARQPAMALDSCKQRIKRLRARQGGAGDQTKAGREQEVWEDLAEAYVALRQWPDAEECVKKALELGPFTAGAWHVSGLLEEARENIDGAAAAYQNALAMDPDHVISNVRLGGLLLKIGGSTLAIARSHLRDALQLEPNSSLAWQTLGLVHEGEGNTAQAKECFEAADLLGNATPVLPFSAIPWAL